MSSNSRRGKLDAHRVMRPLLVSGRVIGLGALPVERDGRVEEVPIISIFYSATVCVGCLVMMSISLASMIDDYKKIATKEREKLFNVFIMLVGWLIFASTSIECQLTFLFRRRRIHELLKSIARVPMAKDSNCIALSTKASIIFNSLYIVALVSITVYGSSTKKIPLDVIVTLPSAVYFMESMISRLTMVTILRVLCSQFKNINDQILSLKDDESWVRAVAKSFQFKRSKALAILSGARSFRDTTLNKVRRLAYDHQQLTDYCSQWNSLFGLNCVMITVNTSFTTICLVYKMAGKALNLVHATNLETEMWCAFGWTLATMVAFATVVFRCSSAANEANQTAKAVSKALISANDEQIQLKLKDFSAQLLHTRVNFTACDLFNLEKSLFTSMGATIVTYFVIIIQFQMADVPEPLVPSSGNETSDS